MSEPAATYETQQAVCGRPPSEAIQADLARVHGVVVLPCRRPSGHRPEVCAHLTKRTDDVAGLGVEPQEGAGHDHR